MSLNDYLDKCDRNTAEFDIEFAKDEAKLDEYINDAYAILDNAMSELYMAKDVMSQVYSVVEFEQHMIAELSALFNKNLKVVLK
jgi:preprotein translocase subunit SecA